MNKARDFVLNQNQKTTNCDIRTDITNEISRNIYLKIN